MLFREAAVELSQSSFEMWPSFQKTRLRLRVEDSCLITVLAPGETRHWLCTAQSCLVVKLLSLHDSSVRMFFFSREFTREFVLRHYAEYGTASIMMVQRERTLGCMERHFI